MVRGKSSVLPARRGGKACTTQGGISSFASASIAHLGRVKVAIVGTGRARLSGSIACGMGNGGGGGGIGLGGRDHELSLRRRGGEILTDTSNRIRPMSIVPAHHGKSPRGRRVLIGGRQVGSVVAVLVRVGVGWMSDGRATVLGGACIVEEVAASTASNSTGSEGTGTVVWRTLLHFGVSIGAVAIVSIVALIVVIVVVGGILRIVGSAVGVSFWIFVVSELGREGGIGLFATMTTVARTSGGDGGGGTHSSSTGARSVGRGDMVVLGIKSGPGTTGVTEFVDAVARRTLAEAEEVGMAGA